MIHRFCAPDDAPVTLIEVSTPEIDDVVRLEDDYNREYYGDSRDDDRVEKN